MPLGGDGGTGLKLPIDRQTVPGVRRGIDVQGVFHQVDHVKNLRHPRLTRGLEKPPVGLLQRGLGPFQFRDVPGDPENTDHFPVLVPLEVRFRIYKLVLKAYCPFG